MRGKLGCVLALVLAMAATDAYAQTMGRQLVTITGSRSSLAIKQLRCGWSFWWDPIDAYAELQTWVTLTSNGRRFGTYGNGLFGTGNLETALDGTYLPSITFKCGSDGIVLWPGSVGYYGAYEEEFQWENDSCTGWAPLLHAISPTTSYAISGELYAWSTNAYYAIESGAGYWGAVGSELNYPQLQTVPGGEVTFYPSLDMAPNEAGAYTHSTSIITFNANISFSYDQWALVAAHEFGHAVGLYHTAYGDPDTSLMIRDGGGETGLQTRTLDKCSIVQHYPVDIQIS